MNKLLSGILRISRRSDALASFKGPMLSFPIIISINREKSVLRRWIVFSQGKRSTLVRYLFGKLLWDELNSLEKSVFWCLSEIVDDNTIFLALRALNMGVNKTKLRQRLIVNPFGLWYITRQQYISIKGRVNFFFLEENVSLRKTTKYSGYTKHYKDKGSIGTQRREPMASEFLDPIIDVSEEVILRYLTVGEITLLGEECYIHPDDGPISPKRCFK